LLRILIERKEKKLEVDKYVRGNKLNILDEFFSEEYSNDCQF